MKQRLIASPASICYDKSGRFGYGRTANKQILYDWQERERLPAKRLEDGAMKLWTEIYTTSEYCLDILNQSETQKGDKCRTIAPRVHSVYHKTINLAFPGGLLGLQCSGSPLAPTSLVCALTEEELKMIRILAGMEVGVKDQAILIPPGHSDTEYIFSFKYAETVDLRLKPLADSEVLRKVYKNVKHSVWQSPAKGFNQLPIFFGQGSGESFWPPDDCGKGQAFPSFINYAQDFLLKAERFFQREAWGDTANALSRLIGLGIGLTPSGDDFLCGTIAGFILLGRTGHPLYSKLEACIQEKLDQTNEISSSFLSCALKGQFSLPVVNIKTYRSARDLYEAFSAIGHSSGIDTLCGILYLFSLFIA